MIRIAKFPLGGGYMVRATPPEVWKPYGNLLPLSPSNIVEELIRHGASLRDAFDAVIAHAPEAAGEFR